MINRNIVFATLLAMSPASSCLFAQPFFFRKNIPLGINSWDIGDW